MWLPWYIRSYRADIRKNMKPCEATHEAYQYAILVEHRLKRSYTRQLKSRDEKCQQKESKKMNKGEPEIIDPPKSLQTLTRVIENENWRTRRFQGGIKWNSMWTRRPHWSKDRRDKWRTSGNWRLIYLVNNEIEHPMDLITMPIPQPPICSLENKSIISLLSQEDLSVEVPHIDFIFGDEWNIVQVCSVVIQIPPFVNSLDCTTNENLAIKGSNA